MCALVYFRKCMDRWCLGCTGCTGCTNSYNMHHRVLLFLNYSYVHRSANVLQKVHLVHKIPRAYSARLFGSPRAYCKLVYTWSCKLWCSFLLFLKKVSRGAHYVCAAMVHGWQNRMYPPEKEKSHLLMYSTIKVRNGIQATPQGCRL